jgi:hypothetical protein
MSDVPSRILRETLRDSLAPPSSSGCLDADVLAAWSDGTLSRRERAVAESHASTCARCQAMLAAMAKIAEPLPARKWWQASTVRWLVPIAVVPALAVVVWMNVPAERQAATAPPPPPPRSDFSAPSAPAAVAETRPAEVVAPTAKDTRAIERADTKRREQPAARADERSAPAPAADAALSAKQPAPSAPQPAPSSAVQPQDAASQTFRARDAAKSAPAQASSAQAPSVQPPAAQAPAELRSPAARALTERLMIAAQKTVALLEIPSPNRNVRWRIVGSAIVERSTDGGTTWQAQSTGASLSLAAGAAPSTTICWLVGPGGVVMLSRDGRTWQRVAFPETIDLTAIRATDDSNATATAADGRVFVTTDGGKTWRPL